MLVKIIAILFIIIGVAGLILPILPGILMIAIGILLLYRERHEEINKIINEKAPPLLADFYNNFLHKLIIPRTYIGIDWNWVKKEVLKSEKLNNDSKNGRNNKICTELEESMRKARSLALPRYTSIEKKITRFDINGIELEGGVFFFTKKIPIYIKGASSIILFLVTIGDEIEKAASSLISNNDPLKGYLLDRIGSFAVESFADSFEKSLRKNYALDKKSVSSRFSPGYCDWPIEEQFLLAKALDFSKAGVILTEGCMMVPKKSISAIVAVAEEGVFKEFVSSCDICEKKDCGYRR